MTTKLIKTASEYEAAKRRAASLVGLDPIAGTPEADELEVLVFLLTDYENKHFPLPNPDPIEAIRFRMEQAGLTQQDLVPYIGSKSKVSEVLAGKRRLTLSMIRALSTGLGIPLSVLVQLHTPPAGATANVAVDWKRLPIRDMATRGYFGALRSGKALRDSADALVRDFLAPLERRRIAILTKQSHHVRSDRALEHYALFAWSAQIMREALSDKPAVRYRSGVVDDDFMRHIARLSWSAQGPLLAREFLNQHGISLIIERHLPRTYLDGAALLVDLDHPVIGMTLRYDRLDNFWFCLMHELAHIRLHLHSDQGAFYDDLEAEGDARETEADELAREVLVPRAAWENSAACTLRSQDAAISLAKRLNVHPAVVAGRMRREARDFTLLTPLLGHVRQLFPEYQGATGA
jgi:HTH-type transcriptional regulator/antitoxin HigA